MTYTGGSAFPVPTERNEEGMSLRDYFAAKAMQAELTYTGVEGCDAKLVASMSYEVADAMLEARRK